MPHRDSLPDQSDVMPVFAIKARDNLALDAVRHYRRLCEIHGLHGQARQVDRAIGEIAHWRVEHEDECKWPDHDHVRAGLPGSGSEAVALDETGLRSEER